MMIRSELYAKIAAENPHLMHEQAVAVVDTIFETITAALERGYRVEIRGFGAFSCRQREGRIGRNPKNGATVDVAPKVIPWFKPGKAIRDRLNTPD
jgi:integration host factor subunit beta